MLGEQPAGARRARHLAAQAVELVGVAAEGEAVELGIHRRRRERVRGRHDQQPGGLGIAERELWATTPPRKDDWELARRIRAGDVPENAVAVLKEQVAEKLRISNPRYLAKYDA